MTTEIMCPINLFDMEQNIYICGDNQQELVGRATIDNLIENMIGIGEANHIFNYHLLGNDSYANQIAEDIQTTYYSKYSDANKIEVKVN